MTAVKSAIGCSAEDEAHEGDELRIRTRRLADMCVLLDYRTYVR
jgi:hypothetical protein